MEQLNRWQNAEEIFYPKKNIPYEILNNLYEAKYLKYSKYDIITQEIYHPVRSIIADVKQYTYYSDGNMEKKIIHSIYPDDCVDVQLLNTYGQMVYNSYMKKYKPIAKNEEYYVIDYNKL